MTTKRALYLLVAFGVAMAQQQQKKTAPAPVKSFVTVYTIADGSKKVVYTAEGFYQAPNWSPDGKYLLLNSPGKLWKLWLDGGKIEPVDIGDVRGVNNDHGITKDGKWFAISAGNVYVLPSTGGSPRQVTSQTPSYFHGWSPDGKWLAMCAKRGDNFDIYRISVDGGAEDRLTTNPGYDDGPEYSPDGKWIYFNSNRSGSWDIWRMPSEGAGEKDANAERVTEDELEDWFPHFSPDGKWMLVFSFPKGTAGHNDKMPGVILRVMRAPGKKLKPAKFEDLAMFYGGQGTINVNSW